MAREKSADPLTQRTFRAPSTFPHLHASTLLPLFNTFPFPHPDISTFPHFHIPTNPYLHSSTCRPFHVSGYGAVGAWMRDLAIRAGGLLAKQARCAERRGRSGMSQIGRRADAGRVKSVAGDVVHYATGRVGRLTSEVRRMYARRLSRMSGDRPTPVETGGRPWRFPGMAITSPGRVEVGRWRAKTAGRPKRPICPVRTGGETRGRNGASAVSTGHTLPTVRGIGTARSPAEASWPPAMGAGQAPGRISARGVAKGPGTPGRIGRGDYL
jgi:hypothetical protein